MNECWSSIESEHQQDTVGIHVFSFLAIETNTGLHLYLSPPSLFSPIVLIKSPNNSLLSSSHSTEFYTYYFQFSPELTCRHSSIANQSTCFYYPSSMNFTEFEQHYDQLNNSSLTALVRSRTRFLIIHVILIALLLTTCILGLYLLCTKRLSSEHMIQLDYTIDPQLAREAAIKLAPEPVWTKNCASLFITVIVVIHVEFEWGNKILPDRYQQWNEMQSDLMCCCLKIWSTADFCTARQHAERIIHSSDQWMALNLIRLLLYQSSVQLLCSSLLSLFCSFHKQLELRLCGAWPMARH